MHSRLFLFLLLGPLLGAAEPVATEVKFTEVIRKEVRFGDYTMTLVRVRPPVLPDVPVTPPPPPRSLTAEEKAYEERVAKKAYATLNVSAAVYLGGKNPVTALRWCDATGKTEFRAWSNIDFRYLTQISMIETETTIYSWFPFLEIYDLAEWPADQKSPLPPGLVLAAGEPAYFVDSPVAKLNEEEATLAGLDYLHAYYQLHYAELKADHERREVLNAAEAKKLRENPPRTPDATFRFWPIKSRLHSR
jgi:hypothetical protein